MFRFFLILCSVTLWTSAANAETIEVLVSERAAESYGAEFPETGQFLVSMKTDNQAQALLISDFWIDKKSGQFIANLVIESGETRRITGAAILTVAVPVPARRLMPDEIVTEADITTISLPYRRVGMFAVISKHKLIGMQVKRVLASGRPVMTQSVMAPNIIDRGDRVSIKYKHGAMSLSAPGKAISDAHLDQDVRVVNLISNKTVIGMARADGIVEVFN